MERVVPLDEEYDILMYTLGDAMDKDTCSIDDFISQLETFYYTKGMDEDKRVRTGGYIHQILTEKDTKNVHVFLKHIIAQSPKGLIRYLVENKLTPSKTELSEYSELIIRILCDNRDPNASVLQYLIEDAKLIEFESNIITIYSANTVHTLRFLLRQNIDYDDERCLMNYVISRFSQQAEFARILLEEGCKPPLYNWHSVDLATFCVMEEFYSREEIVKWIGDFDSNICVEIWPYIHSKYNSSPDYNTFVAFVEYIDVKLLDSDIFTYELVKDAVINVEECFKHLATLINCSQIQVPFKIASNLSILDRHLIWNTRTAKYFSRALKRRLFTLFCVFRRQYGSTLFLKPVTFKIAAGAVSDDRDVEKQEASSFWRNLSKIFIN